MADGRDRWRILVFTFVVAAFVAAVLDAPGPWPRLSLASARQLLRPGPGPQVGIARGRATDGVAGAAAAAAPVRSTSASTPSPLLPVAKGNDHDFERGRLAASAAAARAAAQVKQGKAALAGSGGQPDATMFLALQEAEMHAKLLQNVVERLGPFDQAFGQALDALVPRLMWFRYQYGSKVTEREPVSLLFFGDSTFRNQFQALCWAVDAPITWDKGEQHMAWCSGRLGRTLVSAAFANCIDLDTSTDKAVVNLKKVLPEGWASFTHAYFGAGLWLLWPVPLSNLYTWWSHRKWENYETMMTDSATLLGQYAARVIVSTPHSVCDDQLFGNWRQVYLDLKRGGTSAKATVAKCVANTSEALSILSQPPVAPATLAQHCREGLRSHAAVAALRSRLLRTFSEEGRGSSTNTTVVDAFALTDGNCMLCNPGDAQHFHRMLFDELALLFDAIGWPRFSQDRTSKAHAGPRAPGQGTLFGLDALRQGGLQRAAAPSKSHHQISGFQFP